MLWKYSPSLADWDISVSYAIHTKDVKKVEYFLVEFKIIRFNFSMDSNCIYEISWNLAMRFIWTCLFWMLKLWQIFLRIPVKYMSGQITGGQMGELPSLYSRSTPCCSSLADGDLNSTETFVMVSPRQYLLHILMRTEKYFGPLTACFWQTAVCYN